MFTRTPVRGAEGSPYYPAMTPRAQLSLGLVTFGTPTHGDWRHLLEVARAVDEAGVDRLVLPDHVVIGPDTASYPWGTFPTDATADWLEPLTTMAALAAVTQRVRFLTGVLVAGLRPAPLLAKTVATLDVLSGGRVDLGVGVGWQRAEFDALERDFRQRGQLLDDTIAACRTLWAGEPLGVTGPDGTATQVWCAPTPAQRRLPVWFSGTVNDRNVRRIVGLGDGWIPIMGATTAEVADGTTRLRAALDDAGRDPDALQVRASPPLVRDASGAADLEATMAEVPELIDAGATDIHLPLRAFTASGSGTEGLGDAAHRLAAAFAQHRP